MRTRAGYVGAGQTPSAKSARWAALAQETRFGSAKRPKRSCSCANPGIEQGVEQIDDQIHDRDDRSQQQNSAQDDWVVTGRNAIDEVAAEPRHGVDRFHEE